MDTNVTYTCLSPSIWSSDATTQMNAFKGLGANAVGLTFPLYTDGIHSDAIYAKYQCGTNYQSPTAAQLQTVVLAAQSAGLHVLIRPTLNEQVLTAENPGYWRGVIKPSNVSKWFAALLTTLTPYLQMAQSTGVQTFVLTTELESMNKYSNWTNFIKDAKKLYSGTLMFTDSWHKGDNITTWPGTSLGMDTYQAAPTATTTSTPQQLIGAWNAALKVTPIPNISKVYMNEVNVIAEDGAYRDPPNNPPLKGAAFNQMIQANWDTMACAFMKENKTAAIFFYGAKMIHDNGNLASTPDKGYKNNVQPDTQIAIENCFGKGSRPTISSLSAKSVTVKGRTSVVVTGANFLGMYSISIAGTDVNFTVSSNSKLTLTTQAHKAGSELVVLTSEAGVATTHLIFK